MSTINRFEEKIERITESGCWIWMGYCAPSGYGRFLYNGKVIEAHRASYALHKTIIPNGLFVLHRCDNKSCVNPNHLFLGTQMDNIKDMMGKGRNRNGNIGKTHCKRGHKFDKENTYIERVTGKRQCKSCSRTRRQNQA